jgi:hypothetical protein
MPDLNEFFDKPDKEKPYNLEQLNGVRPCSKCKEDVSGAFWDPMEMIMSWKCSNGHETIYEVG